MRLWALGRSGKLKRGSNAISGCRENCETLCSFSLPLILSHKHSVAQTQSETAISEAASMPLVTSIFSAISIILGTMIYKIVPHNLGLPYLNLYEDCIYERNLHL
jgi:hypothetical protein